MSRFASVGSLLVAFSMMTSALAPATAIADEPAPVFAAPPPNAGAPMEAEFALPARSVPTYAQVRAALVTHRKSNVAAFHAYAKRGVYPSNTFRAGALNVWRDNDGHFCAAATMIRACGAIDLTDRVADQDNFIHLADVTDGPVMDWILTSGLTQAEVAMIQEPMMPVVREPGPAPVDTAMRKAENKRLAKKYKEIERKLAAAQRKSLDRAAHLIVDTRPDLANLLVYGG